MLARRRASLRASIALGAAFVAAPFSPAVAQGTAAGIAGIVRDASGMPLGGITIEARHEATGYVARITTTASGRYLLLSLPLGGPYTVRSRAVGFRVAERRDITLTIGARPQVDFVLERIATPLAEVAVRAERLEGRESRVGGSVRVGREQVDALPVGDRNFSSLSALSPLVGAQLSLGGQRWTSTDIRIDGAQSRNMLRAGETNGGPASISLEAIREFEVNSAVFDATQGRQGGGQISAVTRYGTNAPEARLFTAFRNERLTAARDFQRRPRDGRQAQFIQSALALGGPIVRDRAHYFVTYERQDSDEPLVTGDVSTAQAQVAASINRDSLQRVLDILDSRYGTSASITQVGRLSRRPVSQNLFTRLDWQLTPAHRLTMRATGSQWDAPLSGGVDQAIALREARSSFTSRERQLLASLASTVGSSAHNELQLSLGDSRRALAPESPGVPRGFVQVRSLLPDGTTGNTTIQFGGNRLAPDDSREAQLQLLDRLTLQRGSWFFTLGTDNTLTTTRTFIAESQSGLFVFPSIAALQSGTPNRFTRTVPLGGPSPVTRQRVLELGAFSQAEWEVSNRLTITGGVRWDATAFLSAPPTTRAVDSLFGVRTGAAPRDLFQLQPRIQALWRVTDDGRDVVRIGVGRFAAQPPYYAQHNQLLYTGRSLADIDLRGTNVPNPDFISYRHDPSTVPGLPSGAAMPPAYVNVAGDYRAPRTTKALVAWQHRVTPSLTTTLAAHASRSTNSYHYFDLNLRDTPSFRLANEGNRGVWVPAATIPAATGTTDVRNAARVAGYARVLQLQSTARATSQSVTADADYKRGTWLRATLGYAWGRARDNSTYGCCLARTSTTFTPVRDDPRALEQAWASADLDTRHRIVGTFTVRTVGGIVASARYLGASGRPFSLVVDGDINGDEANGNDLAFLFDPDDPSTATDVAASMRRVMANKDNIAASYIRDHLGEIAGRNTLYTPWTHLVDARLSRRIGIGGSRYADLLLDVFNLGNLLNRNWGAQYLLPVGISSQNPVVNRVALLRVVGFDQGTQRFKYTVNESAGVLPRVGDPYQLQFAIRLGY
ncbi:MAG: TonB-dependent receptor [Gemmatimonadaceae bacterium]